jgi:putative oxidoreductase
MENQNSEKPVDRANLSAALLIARLAIGVIFAIHGSQLLFGAFGGAGLAATVKMMGPLGYLVTIGEFFGGLGLIVGFLSRFSSAALIVIMLGAIFTVHLKNGLFMNWYGKQAGEGFEYHILAIALFLIILIVGPGQIAASRFLKLPKFAE